ncbi:ABC transporter substrate-binding protein [Nonomuraea thailandensis]
MHGRPGRRLRRRGRQGGQPDQDRQGPRGQARRGQHPEQHQRHHRTRLDPAAGGDAKNVGFTELAFPDMLAALDKGNVDAVQVVEPFLATARKNGDRVIASNYVDTAPGLAIAGYFTSQQTAAAKADLVRRFSSAMRKSLQYATDNPDAVRKVLGTYTKIDPALTGSLTLPRFPAEVDSASLETLSELALQDGLIDKAPDLAGLRP